MCPINLSYPTVGLSDLPQNLWYPPSPPFDFFYVVIVCLSYFYEFSAPKGFSLFHIYICRKNNFQNIYKFLLQNRL